MGSNNYSRIITSHSPLHNSRLSLSDLDCLGPTQPIYNVCTPVEHKNKVISGSLELALITIYFLPFVQDQIWTTADTRWLRMSDIEEGKQSFPFCFPQDNFKKNKKQNNG